MSQYDVDVTYTSTLCSYLGTKILSGDVEAVKGLYINIWRENPALLKTATLLQEGLY